MDLGDLFDVADQPRIKLKGTEPRHVHIDLAVAPVEPTEPSSDEPEDPEPQDGDLNVDIATRAKTAAQAHDAYTAAKAAYDDERSQLQEKMDETLANLHKGMAVAKEAESEAKEALGIAMKKDGITTIPMTDRPDIRSKTVRGGKKGITRKWLDDPENIAIEAYEAALTGEPTFKTGKEFVGKIWDTQPKSGDTKTVIIPDVYEDEPDRN